MSLTVEVEEYRKSAGLSKTGHSLDSKTKKNLAAILKLTLIILALQKKIKVFFLVTPKNILDVGSC